MEEKELSTQEIKTEKDVKLSNYSSLKKREKANYKTAKKSLKYAYKERKHNLKRNKAYINEEYYKRMNDEEVPEEVTKELNKSITQQEIELKTLQPGDSDYTVFMTDERLKELRKKNKLPNFTHGEEIFNSVTHIVGAGIGVIELVVAIILCCIYKKNYPSDLITMIIFGISIITLYTISSIYHGLHINRGKRVFRILDHCTIFFMIIGSYIPICVLGLGPIYPTNYIFLAVIIAINILGIVLNATMLDKITVKTISMVIYIVGGWAILIFSPTLIQTITISGYIIFLLGGATYTVGAILYGIGSKKKYWHSIFHLFVLVATILQYLGIVLYLIV